MLAIAGDSAAGKTTLSNGLVQALAANRCVSVCVDDYHRYDRQERKTLPFTALHPDCNYVEIMEQYLQLLATGCPILKPVYDHGTGLLARPELLEPAEFIIVEGLLPLHSKLARTCFDVTVYLDPPENVRRTWKINRDTGKRGYTVEQVTAEMQRRRPESDEFILPQRSHADIVVRFSPATDRDEAPDTALSAELLLRPTIHHPDLTTVLAPGMQQTIHLTLQRDEHGRPVDALYVHPGKRPTGSRTRSGPHWSASKAQHPAPSAPLERTAAANRWPSPNSCSFTTYSTRCAEPASTVSSAGYAGDAPAPGRGSIRSMAPLCIMWSTTVGVARADADAPTRPPPVRSFPAPVFHHPRSGTARH
jgi:phosphoribulokinase